MCPMRRAYCEAGSQGACPLNRLETTKKPRVSGLFPPVFRFPAKALLEGESSPVRARECEKGPRPESGSLSWISLLPARLGDARKLAAVRHVAEAHTGDAVLAEDTARTAVDR